jgi:hypothetical protein
MVKERQPKDCSVVRSGAQKAEKLRFTACDCAELVRAKQKRRRAEIAFCGVAQTAKACLSEGG